MFLRQRSSNKSVAKVNQIRQLVALPPSPTWLGGGGKSTVAPLRGTSGRLAQVGDVSLPWDQKVDLRPTYGNEKSVYNQQKKVYL